MFAAGAVAVSAAIGGCGCSAAPPGQPGYYCSKIDPPTLAKIFPDGKYNEQKCKNFFGDGSSG